MKFFTLSLILLSNRIAAAAPCGSAIITSQNDADVLVGTCTAVTGDIILATNATGSISLDGIQVVDGNLISESCGSICASFTSLTSSTLVSVSQNISLQNLPFISSISFSRLQTVGGQFYLDSLPKLQSLSIPALSSVGQFYLGSAPNLVFMNLTQLQNVTGQNASIEVISVGLSDLSSLDVNTNLSSFILRDCPNLPFLGLSTPQIDYLEISQSSQPQNCSHTTADSESPCPTLGFSPSAAYGGPISYVGTLNMSGCGEFLALSLTTFDTMILSQNSFDYLNLQEVKVLNNLSLINNYILDQVLLPIDTSIPNIEIRDNEGPTDMQLSGGAISEWPWGIKNASSMIFEGEFGTSFFEAYEPPGNFTLIEVSKEFVVNSIVPGFDCSFLNSLRKQGVFQGNYSCQGTTLAAGPVRSKPISSIASFSAPVLSMVAGVGFSLVWSVL